MTTLTAYENLHVLWNSNHHFHNIETTKLFDNFEENCFSEVEHLSHILLGHVEWKMFQNVTRNKQIFGKKIMHIFNGKNILNLRNKQVLKQNGLTLTMIPFQKIWWIPDKHLFKFSLILFLTHFSLLKVAFVEHLNASVIA